MLLANLWGLKKIKKKKGNRSKVNMAIYNRRLEDSLFGVVLSKIILFLLAIFTFYLIFLNISYSLQNNAIIYAILIIPLFAAIFFISFKVDISPLAFTISVFLLAVLFKGLIAVLIDTQPVSDFNTFYQCAIKLVNGDKTFGHTYYFTTWAYQTGPVIYYAVLIKIFGTGLLPLKLINCFFMAISNVLIYLIARKISNDYTARFVAVLYLLYPAPYFLASVLTNQHFAASMFLLSIYILLSEHMNFLVRGVIAGVIMSFGNAVRPLGVVIVIAAVIWGVIELIRTKKVFPVIMVAALLAGYLCVNFGISSIVKYYDINPEGLRNNYPLWKFVVGFNYNSRGQFSYADQDEIFMIENPEQRDAKSKQVIKERLSIGPGKLAGFLNTKQKIMWADFDTLRWAFYKQIDKSLTIPENLKKYEPHILRIEKVYYIFIFIFTFLGLGRLLWKKSINSGITFLSVLLLCYFGIHLLIEIQVRYRYFAVILLFILAAKGSELVFSRFHTYRRKYSLRDI